LKCKEKGNEMKVIQVCKVAIPAAALILIALYLKSVPVMPEPGTYTMVLAGIGAIGFIARRRR
jgi:hypothetical protein